MVRLTILDVAVDVPAGWAPTSHPTPTGTLVARPDRWPGVFVPVLAVSQSVPKGSMPLAGYADRLTADTLLTLGGHLVHVGTGHRPYDHVDLTLATEAWGVDVTVTQRYVTTGAGRPAALATAVVADGDWSALAAEMVAAVRSLRPVAPAGLAR